MNNKKKRNKTNKYKNKIYCGNNMLSTEILSGSHFGTRHSCLKRGFGLGYNTTDEKLDSYSNRYRPLDTRKFYCGNNNDLPENYDIMGNLPICHNKGVGMGIGAKLRIRQHNYNLNVLI